MITAGQREVVIIGASLAGLFAAAATAAAGARTTIIERDVLPDSPGPRKGVPQGRQPHVMLHRGLLAAEELVPGIREDLLRHGAVPFDTGTMAWLGEYGWLPTWIPAYETVSATRPLLEHLVRERVRDLDGVAIHEGVRVTELHRDARRWQVVCDDATTVEADLVIDASGRGSRLPHWLAELGIPLAEPLTVDAHLGYACRMYRCVAEMRINTAVVIAATPQTGRGVLAIPVENARWLIIAVGYGDRRPSRDAAEFDEFLATLPDPAVWNLSQHLEPVSDIAIHRQTGNRRNRYGQSRAWPAGLLAIGDAYCAFNPVYGQGITVAACQAQLIREALKHDRTPIGQGPMETRRLQRRIGAAADLPWSVATTEDLRHPSSSGSQTLLQRLVGLWSAQLARLAAHGDRGAYLAFARVYHLMAAPAMLFNPAVVMSVCRAAVRGMPEANPRPRVLNALAQRMNAG
ncbi:MAG TPA: FAD-dependent monooxygenase [Propionibacteriaceae bacterium]|nr:FAD-dependent monooxygenase [Propionibacteriaceae bacterium]